MSRKLIVAQVLVMGCLVALDGCANSDDTTGGGGAAQGGSGATDGSVGGSGGHTGGSGGTSATGGTSAGGQAGSGGAAGGGATGGTGGGEGGLTCSVTGTLVDLLDMTQFVSGVKICVYQDPNTCTTSDSVGAYTLAGVPANQDVMLEYTKSGYFPTLVTVATTPGVVDLGLFPAPSTVAAQAFATLANITLDTQKGQVLALALQPGMQTGQDSVVAAISPQSGSGPYYTNNDPTPIPDPTATSTASNGVALFANVDPGDAEVTLTHFSKTCTRVPTAWAGSVANGSKLKVVAGYLTGGPAVTCQ